MHRLSRGRAAASTCRSGAESPMGVDESTTPGPSENQLEGVERASSLAYGRMKDAHSRLRFSESAVRVKSYEDCYDMP